MPQFAEFAKWVKKQDPSTIDWESVAKDFPDYDVNAFRSDLAGKSSRMSVPAGLTMPKLTSDVAVAEATKRPTEQIGRSISSLKFQKGLLGGLTFGAYNPLEDAERVAPESLKGGTGAEIAGNILGSLPSIVAIGSGVGAVPGLAKIGTMGRLGKIALPAVREGLAGGIYGIAQESVQKGEFEPLKVAEESFLWAGLGVAGNLAGRGIKALAEKLKRTKGVDEMAGVLKSTLEESGGSQKPLDVYKAQARKYMQSQGIVEGEGFVMKPHPKKKQFTAHIARDKEGNLLLNKEGNRYVRFAGLKPGQYQMRPESFWPLSTEVIRPPVFPVPQLALPKPEKIYGEGFTMVEGKLRSAKIGTKKGKVSVIAPKVAGRSLRPIEQPTPPMAEPPAAKPAGVKAVAKEPWEMTRDEFWDFRKKEAESPKYVAGYRKMAERYFKDPQRIQEFIEEEQWSHHTKTKDYLHETVVEQALKDGKPVPSEVLADYPDLAAKYAKPATEPPPIAGSGEILQPKPLGATTAKPEIVINPRVRTQFGRQSSERAVIDVIKYATEGKTIPSGEIARQSLSMMNDIEVPVSSITPDITGTVFSKISNKTKRQAGFVDISWLEKPVETAKGAGTEFKLLFSAPHEALPDNLYRPIYDAELATQKVAAYYNQQLILPAVKAGIKEGSEASEAIWLILDNVDTHKLVGKTTEQIKGDVPKLLWDALTPAQREYIPQYAQYFDEWAEMLAIPPERRIGAYATHIRDYAKSQNYGDLLEILKRPNKGLRTKVFEPFLQKRTIEGSEGVVADIAKTVDVYNYYGIKKAFKEPAAMMIRPIHDKLVKENPELASYAKTWVEDWIGKGNRDYSYINKLASSLTGRVYQGTLFGNVSASLTNLTQTLSATLPEYGTYHTGRGVAKMLTDQGRKDFLETGLMAEYLHGKKIGTFDFFTQAEFVNRGVAFHAGKSKALAMGETIPRAIDAGIDAVNKTQFFLLGKTSAPPLYRQKGLAGAVLKAPLQFTQYPLGQAKLIYSWAKHPKAWHKLAGFAGITVALGGPQALLPTDSMMYFALSDKNKEFLEKWRRNFSLSGLIGVNLAPRFGFGIFPSVSPAVNVVKDIKNVMYNSDPKSPGIWQRVFSDDLKLDFNRDILQSNLIQRDLPMFVKGGVQLKKISENIGLPGLGGRYDFRNDQVISRKSGEVVGTRSTSGRLKSAMIGQSIEESLFRDTLNKYATLEKQRTLAAREATKAILSRDREKSKQAIIDMVNLGVTDEKAIFERVWNEVLRQSLDKQIQFANSLSDEDKAKFLMELQKTMNVYSDDTEE